MGRWACWTWRGNATLLYYMSEEAEGREERLRGEAEAGLHQVPARALREP